MLYRGYYIREETVKIRFIYMLLSFVLSICFLIFRPNLVSLLLGWDGLGLTSYLLIIYYNNSRSRAAGILTILSNRVGDRAILVCIGVSSGLGSWNFFFFDNVTFFFSFFIILAAITKRAQIPFSAWLPAAMAAPTPISSLVHSSTLVTAGVYLLIRFFNIISGSGGCFYIFFIGVFTMLISGAGANFEPDIKKIIALSTLSQLGLIIIVYGLGHPVLAFFHLLAHALFKSLLFMCAGFVIHNFKGGQDSRYVGSLPPFSPLLCVVFGGVNLALCGFPFLAGFYSKDSVLEDSFFFSNNFFILLYIILATGLTVSYSTRLLYISFDIVSRRFVLMNVRDFSLFVFTCTLLLISFSILGGSFLLWFFFSFKGPYIFRRGFKYSIFAIRGARGVFIFYIVSNKFIQGYYTIFNLYLTKFFREIWYLPALRGGYSRSKSLGSVLFILKGSDKGWFEHLGPSGGVSYFFVKSYLLNYNRFFFLFNFYFVSILVRGLFIV